MYAYRLYISDKRYLIRGALSIHGQGHFRHRRYKNLLESDSDFRICRFCDRVMLKYPNCSFIYLALLKCFSGLIVWSVIMAMFAILIVLATSFYNQAQTK